MAKTGSLVTSSRFTPLATVVEDEPDIQTISVSHKSPPTVNRNPKAPTRKINRLSANSRKFFVKLNLEGASAMALLDSGSEVTVFPARILTEKQRQAIRPTLIQLKTYTNQPVTLLGELDMLIPFEGGTVSSRSVLVTTNKMLPVIGTDTIFHEGQSSFQIDPVQETVSFRGLTFRVYSEAQNNAKMIRSIRRKYGSNNQRARSLVQTVIKPYSERIIRAYIPLPLNSLEFCIDGQWLGNDVIIGKGLYCNDQFQNFPLRVCNLGPFDCHVKKGQKLAIISPLDGPTDSTVQPGKNCLKWDESSGVLRMDLDLNREGQGQVESQSKVTFSLSSQPGPGQCCQGAVQYVKPSMSKRGESSMSAEPEPASNREAFINAPRNPDNQSVSMVKMSGQDVGEQSVVRDPSTESWREFIEKASALNGRMAALLDAFGSGQRGGSSDESSHMSQVERDNPGCDSRSGGSRERELFAIEKVLNNPVSPVPSKNHFKPELAREGLLELRATDTERDDGVSVPPAAEDRLGAVWSQMTIGDTDTDLIEEAKRIVAKYLGNFVLGDELPRKAKLPEFEVFPKTSAPIASHNYRTAYAKKPHLRSIIDKNLRQGLIKRTSSAWNSPALLVPKKDGTDRLVIDYRAVNLGTESDHYPIPRIDDLIINLKKARSFSMMDLASGFHQVPLSDGAAKILAFGCDLGQFEWKRMPMGHKNAPVAFQKMMDMVFAGIPPERQLCYIDDVLIHATTHQENLRQFEHTMSVMAEYGLQVKASKTSLLMSQALFLGHVIEDGTIKVCEDRIQGLVALKPPRSKREAQSLFGKFNFLRASIKNFAPIGRHISQTYAGPRFKWTDEAQQALDTLKKLVSESAMTRSIPDPIHDKLIVESDASNEAMGAVLYMCQDGLTKPDHEHSPSCLRPVEFFSKNFTESQRNKLHIREKELLSFKNCCLRWRMYLIGRKFTWWTDSESMRYAERLAPSKEKFAKHLAELSEFDYSVQIKRSHEMCVSDCLSRPNNPPMTVKRAVNNLKISMGDWNKEQIVDPILKQVSNFVHLNRWPHKITDNELAFWRRKRNDLVFGKGGELLLRTDDRLQKLLVPSHHRRSILKAYHDDSFHPGVGVTKSALDKSFVWYLMDDDIRDHIQRCLQCQRTKPNLRPQKPPLARTTLPSGPYQFLALDLTGPFQATDNDNRFILVCCDHFSKRVKAVGIPDKRPGTILKHFKEFICANPRKPEKVLTDNGGEFQGEFRIYLAAKKIKQVNSAPYHPQTNGLVERMNQTIKSKLRPAENEDWDERLPEVIQLINQAPNEETKFSPFEVENGTSGDNPNNPTSHNPSGRLLDLANVHDNVFHRQLVGKSKRAEANDRTGFKPYEQGDLVLMKARSGTDRFQGPLQVIAVFADGASYRLLDIGDSSEFVRRAEELKPFHQPNTESDESSDEQGSKLDADSLNSDHSADFSPAFIPAPAYTIPQRRAISPSSKSSDTHSEPAAAPEKEQSNIQADPDPNEPPTLASSPKRADTLADKMFGPVSSESAYDPADYQSTTISDSDDSIIMSGGPTFGIPGGNQHSPPLPDLEFAPTAPTAYLSPPRSVPPAPEVVQSTHSVSPSPSRSTEPALEVVQGAEPTNSSVNESSASESTPTNSTKSSQNNTLVENPDLIAESLVREISTGETGGTHIRFDVGATHTRFASPDSQNQEMEVLEDNLMDIDPESDPAPSEFAVPDVPVSRVPMEVDSGEGSKKRTRSKDADDENKRFKISDESFDRMFSVESPEQNPADHNGGDAESDDQTGQRESLADQTENDSSFTSASTSCLSLTDAETTCSAPSFYVRGSLSRSQKMQRLRAQIETYNKWLWEFDELDRLDLVRRTYQIPCTYRSVAQIRDYLLDNRLDLRFSRSSYAKYPKYKTWPKVVVEERYSRVNSDPGENSRHTELGEVICPQKLSYFQLMSLCIEYEISLSPESATTRDRLLGRVENYIRVSESLDSFMDNGELWFVYKEGGVASINTSQEANASD